MSTSNRIVDILSARHAPLSLSILLTLSSVGAAEPLRDPTQPASARDWASQAGTGALRLQAIFSSGERRLAIVNGKLVRAGDRIHSAVIEEISADGIRYSRDGRSQVVLLAPSKLPVRKHAAQNEERS